ncbi:SDR family NAD(P)-dependent oxidoreductase [Paenibacillus ginsengarvi]|uniref:SDR family oxidoreductase n=1 Tax=Paenibacillus ginsengarvi TaxID=400777 RepID=A0A3B0CKZ2_9BACL|nr:SDR family oxidoreductase [Paenibacillus ginsengarvi]RKN85194.1 SDR family oxidoreductase [Paenibacillus ginsengarvi]
MAKLEGKIVAITGASSGIGAKTAELIARRGGTPLLMARNREKLSELAGRIGGRCETYELDVSSASSVERVFDLVHKRHGKVDVLVNNAGFGKFVMFEDTPLDDFEKMMDVNYMGLVRCTKAVLPPMRSAGSGQIVNIASLAGKIGTAKSAGYAATKHAVLGLTNSLRQELAGSGITVTAINPGPVDTPFFDLADPSGTYAANVKWFMLTPDQVAMSIVRAMERGRAEVDLPAVAGFGAKLFHLFPRTFERFSRRFLNLK